MKTRHKKQQAEIAPYVAAIIPTETHIVTRGGRPCTLINVSGGHKGGVLIPGSPVISFTQVRDARRAVERTKLVQKKVCGSLVEDYFRQQIPSLLDADAFEILPVGHQVGPEVALMERSAAE